MIFDRHRPHIERIENADGSVMWHRSGDTFLEHPAEDDMSELYWQVMKRAKELGHDANDFLRRLRDAEDEAKDWLALHGPTQQDYDEMMSDLEAQERAYFSKDEDL